MSAEFHLEILTPERRFFDGPAEAITIDAPDGELTILAGHAPLIAPLVVGSLRVREMGVWREAFNSEGFLEVSPEEVVVFSQACEWPEEIDARRADEAKRRAEEILRQQRSNMEYKNSKLALARAMARLRIKQGR